MKIVQKRKVFSGKIFIKIFISLLISCFVYLIVNQDAFLYHQPVGKIIAVENGSRERQKDPYNNIDYQINQKLTIKLLNRQGKIIHLENQAMQSQSMNQLFRKGQQILLTDSKQEGEVTSSSSSQEIGGLSRGQIGNNYTIQTMKRDAVMLSLFTLFVGLSVSFIKWRSSLFLVLSLLANLLLFVLAIYFDVHFTASVIFIYGLLSVLFAFSSLAFVLGWTRQMFYTLLTTVLTTAITFILTLVVLRVTNNEGVHFEYLSYVTQDPTSLFFVSSMISVLGAIMDGSGDIVAGLFGLGRQNLANNLNMNFSDYFKSGLSIGQEIIGTLTNILFMIFMAEEFPVTLLLLRNDNNWSYIATVGLNLGLLQTIISAIGIVLAVPVTAFVASLGIMHYQRNSLSLKTAFAGEDETVSLKGEKEIGEGGEE